LRKPKPVLARADGHLAPANRLAYSLSKRTVAQPDATKRPARMYGGPFLRQSDAVEYKSPRNSYGTEAKLRVPAFPQAFAFLARFA
jgi:hypothetical protein